MPLQALNYYQLVSSSLGQAFPEVYRDSLGDWMELGLFKFLENGL